MSRRTRIAFAAGALAVLSLAPAALRAQAAAAPAPASAADSLAFPRQFVRWIQSSQGDSAFAHAGTRLREAMRSAEGVNDLAKRVAERFGEVQGTDAEVQFDDADLKVYILVPRYSQAPQPGAWIVAYSPVTHVVERASFGALARAKASYPQAKLP